ncbi:MAG: S8 family peptidase, partial [Acidobacteriota bacterium]|nr:S8 family peptidase [Acidobacteriota bacterium]
MESAGGNNKIIKSERAIPNRYIVVLEDWAAGERGGQSNSRGVADELQLVYGGRIDRVFRHAVNGYSAEMGERQADALSRDLRVKYIEEDGEMFANATQNNATWGLDRIDQRDMPLNGTYIYNATGAGVRAYIIDSGIRSTHNEFTGRVQTGYTAISDGRGTDDCNGHGTHVAGTTGGTVYGVAKSVTFVPVRVLNCQGSGTTSGVIAGVDWVTANHVKPAVANMSLGGGASSSLDTAVDNSISAGITYAVAAGNDNLNACNYSPARVATAITVGATTNSDARASYSNFGSCLDIFAPGSSITSAWDDSNTATATISGTSMASPHVAGVAALYLEGNPSASPASVRSAIVGNATSGKVTSAGTGSVNLLLYSGFIGGGGGNLSPTSSFTFSCT